MPFWIEAALKATLKHRSLPAGATHVSSFVCGTSKLLHFHPGITGDDVAEEAVIAENLAANGAPSASAPSADWMKGAGQTREVEPEMGQPDTAEGTEEEPAEHDLPMDLE